MKLIITGGSGFIGSNLTKVLLSAGHTVMGIDNFFYGKRDYIEDFKHNPEYSFAELDLLNQKESIETFKRFNPDMVWHLAANSDISLGTQYTDFDLKGGPLVTYSVLESMRQSKCKKIIFTSSGAIYGEPSIQPTPEDYGPLIPISLYGASKLGAEALVASYAHSFDMQAWIFRFGNIIGSNSTHGVIHDFIKKLIKNPSELLILGDGLQIKPYIHVTECIAGMLHVVENTSSSVNIYNLSTQSSTKVIEIAHKVINVMGIDQSECQFIFTGSSRGWKGDIPLSSLDISKISSLGWSTKLSSNDAVEKACCEILDQMKGRS